jgi:nitrous oxidase accessory protein NosD
LTKKLAVSQETLIKTLLQQKKPPIDWEQVMWKNVTLMLVLVLAASSTVFVLPVKSEARTIVVPDDYSEIEAAIANADSGDTVFVKQGTYQEQTLNIQKAISLIGEDAVNTRINLSPRWIEYENSIPFDYSKVPQYEDALKIDANDVTISGFTFTNIIPDIGGYFIASGNKTSIIGNIIITNEFFLKGFNQVFAQNTLINCSVKCFGKGYTTIAGNTVVGGSIWIGASGLKYAVYNNTVINGDGIAVGGNDNIVLNNTLKNNTFGLTACIYASNNVFYSNTVINNSIGIRNNAEGNNNTFYANHVANNQYGVEARFYFPVGENNVLYHNNFVDNVEQVNTNPIIVLGDGSEWTAYHGGEFDNGKEGNYWSDYKGADLNGDGIGDSPYVIDANIKDDYSLIVPFDVSSVSIELPAWAYPMPRSLPVPSLSTSSSPTQPRGLMSTPEPESELSEPSPQPSTSSTPETQQTESLSVIAVAAVSVAIVIMLGVGLVVYFKKRKH